MTRQLRGLARRICLVGGASVALTGVALAHPHSAHAALTICGDEYPSIQHVVGGNKSVATNGDVSSLNWIRGIGVQGTFWLNPGRTIRNDCAGPAGGTLVKIRFANDDGTISNATLVAGYSYVNQFSSGTYAGTYLQYYSEFDSASGGSEVHNAAGNLVGLCGLAVPNHWVTIRIWKSAGTRTWIPEVKCGSTWETLGTQGISTGYVEGVALGEDWRYGGAGTSLEDTFKGLQWFDWSRSWDPWTHTQCFVNSSNSFKFADDLAASPQPSYDVFNGTPNTGC